MIPSLLLAVAAGVAGEVALETSPASASRWIQNPAGIVATAAAPATGAGATAAVSVRSAVSGAPIAGALAWVVPADDPVPLVTSSVLRSGADGIIRAPRVAGHILRITAPGHELVHLPVPWPASIVLWPSEPAVARLTLDGEPARGVHVLYALGDSRPAIEASADEGGRLTFPFVPRNGVRIDVIDDRFGFASRLLDEKREQTIALKRSVRFEATVLDPAGDPLPNARALAWVRFGSAPRDVREISWSSEEDGTIAISGVPEGAHEITFEAEGYLSRKIRSDDPGISRVILKAGRSPVLRVAGESGPLRNAVVFDRANQAVWTADAEGIARLTGIDASTRPLLRVSARNHLPEEITLGPKDAATRDVRLRKGASLQVRLLDAAGGLPVRSIRTRLSRDGGFRNEDLESDAGEYEIAGFTPGGGELTIRAPGFLPLTIPFDAPASGLDLGTIFLARGASVEGALIAAETGEPLAGASIAIPRRSALGTIAARFFGDVIEAETDADGRFTISGLEGGSVCGTIRHPNIRESLFHASVEPDEFAHVGVLAIGRGGNVAGRVLDDRGDAITDVAAELRTGPLHSPCSTLRSTVDADGRFEFSHVASGHWHLVALKGREVLASRRIEIADGESEDRDLVVAFVEVEGSVTVGGKPAEGGSIKISRAGSESFVPPTLFVSHHGRGLSGEQQPVSDIVSTAFVEVAADGSFYERARLTSGEYAITFIDGDAFYYSRANLAEEQARLDLTLRFEGHRLAGWLLDPSGASAAGAFIHLEDPLGNRLRSVLTADGRFVFPHAPEGSIVVRARRGDLEAVASLEMRSSREDLALSLAAPVSPSVTVAFDEGDGSRIETIYLTDGRDTWRSMSRGAAETVRIPFLRPGRLRLLGSDRAGGIHLGPEVTLGAGEASVTFEAAEIVQTTLTFDAERAGAPVEIRTADGIPLSPILGMHGRSLIVDDSGHLVLPALSEGEWSIAAGSDDAIRIDVSSKKRRISVD